MVPNSLISLAVQRFVAVMVYGFMPHVSMVPTANAMSVHWDRQSIVWRLYSWRLYIRKANIKLGLNQQTQGLKTPREKHRSTGSASTSCRRVLSKSAITACWATGSGGSGWRRRGSFWAGMAGQRARNPNPLWRSPRRRPHPAAPFVSRRLWCSWERWCRFAPGRPQSWTLRK